MKVHNDLKELLEAHTKWVLKFYTLSNGKYDDDLERAFIASNSLALGKPEPLAKNKQTENICDACLKPIRMKNNTLQLLCECDLKSM